MNYIKVKVIRELNLSDVEQIDNGIMRDLIDITFRGKSRELTYLSDIEYEIGTTVIVPYGKATKVGIVTGYDEESNLIPDVTYRHIIEEMRL